MNDISSHLSILLQILDVEWKHAHSTVVNANIAHEVGLGPHRPMDQVPHAYRFSTSLPYLLARLGVRMGELFARELVWEGLTLPMFRVLAALTEAGEPQRLGELSALTSVEMSTMSRLLTEMQRRNFITRERPENDQRSLSVGLTKQGAELAAFLVPRAAAYERTAMGNLSPERARQLKMELAQIYERLNAVEAEIAAAEAARATAKPRLVSRSTAE